MISDKTCDSLEDATYAAREMACVKIAIFGPLVVSRHLHAVVSLG